jgi:hypothetical protein
VFATEGGSKEEWNEDDVTAPEAHLIPVTSATSGAANVISPDSSRSAPLAARHNSS